jgi:hypothetical protein
MSRSPTGEKISVIMGTNHDEMALFLIGIPITINGVEIPLQKAGFDRTIEVSSCRP